ncbi:MAG: diguanylate cyclase [Clostridia bacterium]|nr:diguanylate cyclase [Clostridia bacterium]
MGTNRKPLNKSILLGSVIFIIVLCIVLSLVVSFTFGKMRHKHYERFIKNVLEYAAAGIDADDLEECIRTGVESEKYRELQTFLDGIKESMELDFIYIIVPLNDEPADNVMNVIAGATAYEYEHEADETVKLGELTGDSYPVKTVRKYLDAYESGKLSFFEEITEWGDEYTGLMPLYDSAGNKVAALCMDVSAKEIHTALGKEVILTGMIVALLGGVFTTLFVIWMRHNVTEPLEQLESCVVDFAERSHETRDLDALRLEVPDIRTGNEVESLSRAVAKMSDDLREAVSNVLDRELELKKMNVIAHKDALTGVGNKAAYDLYAEELAEKIANGHPEFAVVMADVNCLKEINDEHGHKSGDGYLRTSCDIICGVFKHSPVFRVGGDEFVVVLTGRDLEAKNALLKEAREAFRISSENTEAKPWERASAALGMAVYREGVDESVADVLGRADAEMYSEKKKNSGAAANKQKFE